MIALYTLICIPEITLRLCQAVLRTVSNPLFSPDGECATITPMEDIVNSFAHALLESNQFSLRNRTSLHYSGLPSPFTLTLTERDRRAITLLPVGAVSSLRVRHGYNQLLLAVGRHGTPTWTRTKNVL